MNLFRKSVDQIISSILKMEDELDELIIDHNTRIMENDDRVAMINRESDDLVHERNRAKVIRDNISSFYRQ